MRLPDNLKIAILAGGMGSRLAEETELKPKPMVEIGGRPILWHILKHYASYGHREFFIALGYKGDEIKRYFLDRARLSGDPTLRPAHGELQRCGDVIEDWTLRLIDTGGDATTGGRVKRLEADLRGQTFMVTYGDGVADAWSNAASAGTNRSAPKRCNCWRDAGLSSRRPSYLASRAAANAGRSRTTKRHCDARLRGGLVGHRCGGEKIIAEARGVGIEQLRDAFGLGRAQNKSRMIFFRDALHDFRIAVGGSVRSFLARQRKYHAGVVAAAFWQYMVRIA